jgi:hypothetical protein
MLNHSGADMPHTKKSSHRDDYVPNVNTSQDDSRRDGNTTWARVVDERMTVDYNTQNYPW